MCVPLQVCDSDTVLDPACTIEMLKILEEDAKVGGVGGDVQVRDLFLQEDPSQWCYCLPSYTSTLNQSSATVSPVLLLFPFRS